jgi:NAD(P)-dependent dehydrogenase (short-subunit alcohol dehydrogenase family)
LFLPRSRCGAECFEHQIVAGIEAIIKTANGEADLFHQIGDCDTFDIEATERAVDRLTKQWGKLDIVFANAGFHELNPIGQTSVAQFEEIIRTNLTGVFFTIQAASPHLNEGASTILNGSVQAVLGIPGFTAYAAAKGGIRTMT